MAEGFWGTFIESLKWRGVEPGFMEMAELLDLDRLGGFALVRFCAGCDRFPPDAGRSWSHARRIRSHGHRIPSDGRRMPPHRGRDKWLGCNACAASVGFHCCFCETRAEAVSR
jgi:hypothetical protein